MNPETFVEFAKVLPEPTVLVNPQGEIMGANGVFARIFSTAPKSLVGKNLAELAITENAKVMSYLQNCSRSPQTLIGALTFRDSKSNRLQYRCEGALVSRSGENGHSSVMLRLKPKDTSNKRFLALQKTIDELNKEIIERRRAEKESNILYRQAKEASKLKDEFLATMSHELRTPLNAILGWARMLQKNDLDEANTAKAIETIERNARTQAKLINDLLEVSRIITGKLRLEAVSVQITDLVEDAIDMVRPTADRKGISIDFTADSKIDLIRGDPHRLKQSIWNLLSNAVKFTPSKGKIEIKVFRNGAAIEVAVKDTGIGIEADFLPFVFDRFRQADGSKSRRYGGMGLGLAVTRHIVELHGGTVDAHSEGPDKGSRFTIRVPIGKTPVIAKPSATSMTLPLVDNTDEKPARDFRQVMENLQILVVEDNRDGAEMLDILLKGYGARVSVANSVSEALQIMQSSPFDILISDVEMPNESGYSMMAKIRADSMTKYFNIGAIALTAHAGNAERKKAIGSGFDFHIAKPFEYEELITTIAEMAASHKKSLNSDENKNQNERRSG